MTFVEAAIEVLKREGKPLTTRRLAELAVKHNLLSVVGRDPESTMQERLEDALGGLARHPELLRVGNDTFGLHSYPPRPYPANGTQAHEPAGEPPKERRRKRRRGGNGEAEGEAAAETDETTAAGEDEEPAVAGGEPAAGAEAAGEAGGGEKKRRRRRGGRGRRRRGGGEAATTEATAASEAEREGEEQEAAEAAESPEAAAAGEEMPPIPEELPSEAEAAGTPPEVAAADAAAEGELVDEEIDEHTGPLLAPALGAEDVMRTEEDRTVRPEIFGTRDERRDRHRHKDRRHRDREHKHEHKGGDKAHEHKHDKAEAKHERKQHEHKQHEHKQHEHKQHEARPSTEPTPPGLIGALVELMRASDGRPMHVRHLVDTALKNKTRDDKATPNETVRLARAALVREQRDRELDGLRPRVRALGGGHYALVDKKLDPELAQAERELGERAARLRDATRAAVRRRLGRMAPPAFDALGRTVCDKLGISDLELIRRGEGVTYWGGTRQAGVGIVRTLVALRPGEGEINRRAVGELRAGLAAKGYDEGLLLAAGRPNGEALADLKNGGVTLYDGAALAALLVKHGLGVRRVSMPVDYLDLDFFFELSEG